MVARVVGWFDEEPSTLFNQPISSVYPEIVAMAGGAQNVALWALNKYNEGEYRKAIHLTNIALSQDPTNATALTIQMMSYQVLEYYSSDSIDKGWLNYGARRAQEAIIVVPNL